MNKIWSLYNRVEKLRIDDLRLDQVRTILLSVPAKKMNEWYACQEGDPQWQSILEIQDLYEETRVAKNTTDHVPLADPNNPSSKKPEVRRPLFEDAPADLSVDPTLQVESGSVRERRSARRYVRDLSFRISNAGKAFTSATVDISMGGLSIKDDLPAGLPAQFKAELQLKNQTLTLMCSKISSHQMRIRECDKWELLRQWLVSW